MPLVQTLLYYIPTFLLATIMVALFCAFSIIGLFVFRRLIPVHRSKQHNDIAGFIFATMGVIYAVLVAFMVVISWQSFDATNSNLEKEANYYADLYRDSTGLSKDAHTKIRTALADYIRSTVNDEWPLLAKGQSSEKAHEQLWKVWDVYIHYSPKTETEKVFFAESVKKMNEANELRRQRIVDAKTGLHPVLWSVLVISGIITILFTFFFGTENFIEQICMTCLLSSLIALVLFTIMVFDFPFTGDISISSGVFKQIMGSLGTF